MSTGQRFRTIIDGHFAEKSSARISLQLLDGAEEALPAAALASLTLTLFDRVGGGIVNSRNQQTVLNANGGTVGPTGLVEMILGGDDTALPFQTIRAITRVAFFEWTFNGGTERGGHEVEFRVANLAKVS